MQKAGLVAGFQMSQNFKQAQIQVKNVLKKHVCFVKFLIVMIPKWYFLLFGVSTLYVKLALQLELVPTWM